MSKSEHIGLAKRQNSETTQSAEVGVWEPIDGWTTATHDVEIMWRVEDGENRFALQLKPKDGKQVKAGVSWEEAQEARLGQHVYPFVAPKIGHEATVAALGIAELHSEL